MSNERIALYTSAIKHLRVIRNITLVHRNNLNQDTIDIELVTPYERGRLCRSSTRLSQDLYELIEANHTRMVFHFASYLVALGAKPQAFVKPGAGHWNRIYQLCEEMINEDTSIISAIEISFPHLVAMMDMPLAKIGPRLTMMRLSVG